MVNRISVLCGALVCLCLVGPLLPASVLADGGMIPIASFAVYEPGQKAIIGWNGTQEVLILSTDVYADSDTTALRIIPLPSEPQRIEQGDFQSFIRVADLIRERFGHRSSLFACGMGKEGGVDGVDIVFHEKIGSHDIWVARTSDATEFIEWAEDFLAQNQIQYQISSPRLESLAGDYIAEGIEFFVFDLVELSPDQNSVEPILYQFQSDTLYYPIRISSIVPGYTRMSLFLLTPAPLDLGQLAEGLAQLVVSEDRPERINIQVALADDEPIQCKLNKQEIESIDQRVASLFGQDAWLTAVEGAPYGQDIPTASLKADLKLTQAFLGSAEKPIPARLVWLWVVLFLAAAGLAWFFYLRWKRASQLRMEMAHSEVIEARMKQRQKDEKEDDL